MAVGLPSASTGGSGEVSTGRVRAAERVGEVPLQQAHRLGHGVLVRRDVLWELRQRLGSKTQKNTKQRRRAAFDPAHRLSNNTL